MVKHGQQLLLAERMQAINQLHASTAMLGRALMRGRPMLGIVRAVLQSAEDPVDAACTQHGHSIICEAPQRFLLAGADMRSQGPCRLRS